MRLRVDRYSQATLAIGLAILVTLLSLVSNGEISIGVWASFFLVLLLAAALIAGVRRLLEPEQPPHWLAGLVLGAVLLRLGLGVFWFVALSVWGYGGPVETAGYVMEDAYARDGAAWELAESGQPLLDAFRGFNASDQYGGLLFLSAVVYRYLPAESHQPLLMVVLSATVSGLAVALAWAFANRQWGERVAKLAAWGLALYPEAALLGSSQMREAFSVTLSIWALFALQRLYAQRTWPNALLFFSPVALSVPLSLPFAAFLFGTLALAALALNEWAVLRRRGVWLLAVGVGVLALAAATLLVDWGNVSLVQSGEFQAYVAQNASGWVA